MPEIFESNMPNQVRRIQILRRMERGEIDFDQASQLLSQNEGRQENGSSGMENPGTMSGEEFERSIRYWKKWWMIPLWIAVGLTILGAFLIYRAFLAGGAGFWFYCAWIPFLFGVGGIVLAWHSQFAHWVHVRVTQTGVNGLFRKIAISLPLPLGLTGWFFRTFERWMPSSVRDMHVEDWIQVLAQSVNPDQPLYVEVNEKENGDRVEVYIG